MRIKKHEQIINLYARAREFKKLLDCETGYKSITRRVVPEPSTSNVDDANEPLENLPSPYNNR